MRISYVLAFIGLSMLALSGCGSSGGSSVPVAPPPAVVDPITPEPEPLPPVVEPDPDPLPPIVDEPIYVDSVALDNLTEGYILEGYNDNGEMIIIEYCMGEYLYYRDADYYFGNFNIGNGGYTINMYDNDGGSYVIDTDNGAIEVGMDYYIFDINNNISVEAIEVISDCF